MPRCGQLSRIAKAAPESVRPRTSGSSSSMAAVSFRGRTSSERTARYQKPVSISPEAVNGVVVGLDTAEQYSERNPVICRSGYRVIAADISPCRWPDLPMHRSADNFLSHVDNFRFYTCFIRLLPLVPRFLPD